MILKSLIIIYLLLSCKLAYRFGKECAESYNEPFKIGHAIIYLFPAIMLLWVFMASKFIKDDGR